MPTTAEILLRDHVRYTGDGLPDAPVGMPAPVGDPESGIHNPSKRDFRLAIGSVTDAADAAQDAADRANEAADGLLSFKGRLQGQIARMMAGEAVTIACYGDSTTDGNSTTGWTPNATNGAGNATGVGANNSPNAWPFAVRTITRRMFGNNTIQVWNAGYGGKDIVTGWAGANFETAIINNPAYGTPDICIVNFGLNDIVRVAYTPAAFRAGLDALIRQINSFGIVPVLLTPDPVMENTDRQGGALSELVAIIKQISELYQIEMIDTQTAILDAISAGGTNALWAFNQQDDLHFNDTGHRIKAGYIAARLFPNTLWTQGTVPVNIAPWSRYGNTDQLSYSIFDQANNRFGASLNVNANTYTAGQPLIDVWYWVDNPDMDAFWRSVSGDGYYSPAPLASAPEIEGTSYLNGSTAAVRSATAGAAQQSGTVREAETPVFIVKPTVGLNRLTFKAPTDVVTRPLFLGYFCLRQSTGSRTYSYSGFWGLGGSGRMVVDRDAFETNAPLLGGGFTRSFNMLIDVAMPDGSGVFIYAGRVFNDGTGGVNRKTRGVVLMRSGANAALWDVSYDSTGVLSATNLGSAAYSWNETSNEFNIRTGAGDGTQYVLQVTPVATPHSPLLNIVRARTVEPWPLGGKLGGLFKDYGISANGGRVRFEIFGISQN